MEELSRLFHLAADHAADYRRSLADRPVGVPVDQAALNRAFAVPLPAAPTPPGQVLAELVAAAEPGLVATAGPRYFGFVVGGALPAATAAEMLAAGWDQIAFNAVTSPAAMAAEAAAGTWLKELLGIPATASVGFVTGGQAANTAGPRRRPPPGARRRRLGRGTARAARRAADAGARRRRTARHHRPVAAPARPRTGRGAAGARRPAGRDRPGRAGGGAARRGPPARRSSASRPAT